MTSVVHNKVRLVRKSPGHVEVYTTPSFRWKVYRMAVASGRAGRVLARPLFHRQNWFHLRSDRSPNKFSAAGHAFHMLWYVAATYTKLQAICDHYLTESTCSNYWNSVCKELQNIRDLGPKNGLRSDLLASNLTKFSWGSMPPHPPNITCGM